MGKYKVSPVPVQVKEWDHKGKCRLKQGYTVTVDGVETYPYMSHRKAQGLVKRLKEEDEKERKS